MSRKVLMVSPHFPPDTSAGTHRVRLLAPYLAGYGWEPTVVTVTPDSYEGRLDPDLAALVPASLRVVRAATMPAHLTRQLGLGDLGLRSFVGLLQACRRLLASERYDALFITIYPTYPALLGPLLKRRHGVPFVLDYQDPWVGSWGRDVGGGANGAADFKSRATRAIALRMEPMVVRAADALTAVSARTYEDVLRRVPGARPRACAAIPIGFDAGDLRQLRAVPRANRWFDAGDGRTHVCYVGTLLPTGIEVLRATLAGLRRLRDHNPAAYARLHVHFLGTSNQRDEAAPARVLPIAREIGVDSVVSEVPGRLDYLDALNVQVQSHALLLLGSLEPHYTASKVFPALLASRPILAVYHAASSVVDILASRQGTEILTFGREDPASLVPRIAEAWERIAQPAGAAAGNHATADDAAAEAAMASDEERIRPWSAHALAGELARIFDTVAVNAA
jgi:glycosyltransferase involved in cell wall biosynthesis